MKKLEEDGLTQALVRAGQEARLRDLSPEGIAETRRLAVEALAEAKKKADRAESVVPWGYGWLGWAATAAAVVLAAFLVQKVSQWDAPEEAAPVDVTPIEDARLWDFYIERQKAAVARDMDLWRKRYLSSPQKSLFDSRSEAVRSRIELCAAGIEEELSESQTKEL